MKREIYVAHVLLSEISKMQLPFQTKVSPFSSAPSPCSCSFTRCRTQIRSADVFLAPPTNRRPQRPLSESTDVSRRAGHSGRSGGRWGPGKESSLRGVAEYENWSKKLQHKLKKETFKISYINNTPTGNPIRSLFFHSDKSMEIPVLTEEATTS